jgi:hypothetical protein
MMKRGYFLVTDRMIIDYGAFFGLGAREDVRRAQNYGEFIEAGGVRAGLKPASTGPMGLSDLGAEEPATASTAHKRTEIALPTDGRDRNDRNPSMLGHASPPRRMPPTKPLDKYEGRLQVYA